MSLFRPSMQVNRIYDIDLVALKKQGIRGLVFDLDNTLTPWHNYAPDQKLIDWFAGIRDAGLKFCILSNSAQAKVEELCPWLDGVPVIGSAAKPGRGGFARACKMLQLQPAELAMVGDQLVTDMLGGNRAGYYTILTQPISDKEFWGTKHFNRRLERLIKRFW